MEVSIVIVSRNRKDALEQTLHIIGNLIQHDKHEVLVYLDATEDDSSLLKNVFPYVKWFEGNRILGASPSRNLLLKKATGTVIVGFDDDAHPLEATFISKLTKIFKEYPTIGLIAFNEIKGIAPIDYETRTNEIKEYSTNEFIGAGYAIRKSVYDQTNGFPTWIDTYGEEACLSIEVISKGYAILYTNSINVHHRVDKDKRQHSNYGYIRFCKQLKNTAFYYMVYHPTPLLKIGKLLIHNFTTYAIKDSKFFIAYCRAIFKITVNLYPILQKRAPLPREVFEKIQKLKPIHY